MKEEKIQAIRNAIKEKYRRCSISPQGLFTYTTGKNGMLELGYNTEWVNSMPAEVAEYFCGVGNPFYAEFIREGERVLDVGCGAGVDLMIASSLVGSKGAACGIDLSEEMAERARENIRRANCGLAQVVCGTAEELPFADQSFDTVISNGVINLSPEKEKVFHEIYRVLTYGGHLQFADIVLESSLSAADASNLQAWSN
jgi:SAM-dependent methyltransferase